MTTMEPPRLFPIPHLAHPSTFDLDRFKLPPLHALSHSNLVPFPSLPHILQGDKVEYPDPLHGTNALNQIRLTEQEEELRSKLNDGRLQPIASATSGSRPNVAVQDEERGPPPFSVTSYDSSSSRAAAPSYTREYATVITSEATALRRERDLSSSSIPHSHDIVVENLFSVLLGNNSSLFYFNSMVNRFEWCQTGSDKGKERETNGRIFGLSHAVSESIIDPFLSIGAAFIRLESIVQYLAQNDGSTTTARAVSSSLAAFIIWARHSVAALTSNTLVISTSMISLSEQLSSLQHTLSSLLETFARSLSVVSPYPPISLSTASLLSLLYQALLDALELSSPSNRLTQLVLAFVMQEAIKHWWSEWEIWVGVKVGREEREVDVMNVCGIVKAGEEYSLDLASLPSFLNAGVAQTMFESGKVLRLIRKVDSTKRSHPLISSSFELFSQYLNDGICWKEGASESRQSNMESAIVRLQSQMSDWRLSRASSVLPPSTSVSVSDSIPPQSQSNSQLEHPLACDLFSRFSSPPTVPPSPFVSFLSAFPPPHVSSTSILPPACPTLVSLIHSSLFTPLLSYTALSSVALLDIVFREYRYLAELDSLASLFLISSSRFNERLRSILGDRERVVWEAEDRGRNQADRTAKEVFWRAETVLREVMLAEKVQCQGAFGLIERDGSEEESHPLATLRLTYSPPSPLDLLLPQDSIVQQYQRISEFLWSMMKCEESLKEIWIVVRNHSSASSVNQDSQSQRDLNAVVQFVQCLFTNVSSYFYDYAITFHWTSFRQEMNDIWGDAVSSASMSTYTIPSLVTCHSRALERIVETLFLNDAVIVGLVEAVFESVERVRDEVDVWISGDGDYKDWIKLKETIEEIERTLIRELRVRRQTNRATEMKESYTFIDAFLLRLDGSGWFSPPLPPPSPQS